MRYSPSTIHRRDSPMYVCRYVGVQVCLCRICHLSWRGVPFLDRWLGGRVGGDILIFYSLGEESLVPDTRKDTLSHATIRHNTIRHNTTPHNTTPNSPILNSSRLTTHTHTYWEKFLSPFSPQFPISNSHFIPTSIPPSLHPYPAILILPPSTVTSEIIITTTLNSQTINRTVWLASIQGERITGAVTVETLNSNIPHFPKLEPGFGGLDSDLDRECILGEEQFWVCVFRHQRQWVGECHSHIYRENLMKVWRGESWEKVWFLGVALDLSFFDEGLDVDDLI